MEWAYFIFGIIVYQILKIMAMAIHQEVVEYRKRKFLRLVNVKFPNNESVTFISVDASDKKSMDKMERQFREQFDLPELNEPFDLHEDENERDRP